MSNQSIGSLSSVPYVKLEKKPQQEDMAPSASSNPVLELELTEEKLPMTLSRQEVYVNSYFIPLCLCVLWNGVLIVRNSCAGDPPPEGARRAGASVRRDRLRRLSEAPQN